MTFPNSLVKRALTAAALSAPLALAACGAGGPVVPDGPRGIFTSSGDCIDSKMFDKEVCRTAIEGAIAKHRKSAPIYMDRRACEAKEIHCERTFTNEFRPRLIAFLVQNGVEKDAGIVALPLYPPNGLQKGMRDMANTFYLTEDFTLTYSDLAQRALAINANTAGKRQKNGMF